MAIVALLGSAGISMLIKHKRNLHNNESFFYLVIEYFVWILSNAVLTLLVIGALIGLDGVDISAFNSLDFFAKYSIISMAIAVVIPYIEEVVKKVFRITFVVKKSENV